MQVGDLCLFYHSNEGKEVVGIAKVIHSNYPDPTAEDPQWVCVDVEPWAKLKKPIGLAQIKKDPMLQTMGLIKQSRLSVVGVKKEEFDRIIELSEN
jgi:predicted RNA-binding protein with PUA-like domain